MSTPDSTRLHAAALAQVAVWVEATGAAMASRLGSQTLCEVHKSGQVTGGVKYDEGRMAAFSDLKRALRGGDSLAADALRDLFTAQADRWQAQLERHQAQPQPSMPWVAYSQGGLDACREALMWLDAHTHTPPG